MTVYEFTKVLIASPIGTRYPMSESEWRSIEDELRGRHRNKYKGCFCVRPVDGSTGRVIVARVCPCCQTQAVIKLER